MGIAEIDLSLIPTSTIVISDCMDLMREMEDNILDCIWTDPPYFLSNNGMTCQGGKMVKVNKGEWDKSKGLEEDHKFNLSWLAECFRILKPTGTIWVCGNYESYPSMAYAAQQVGFRILNDIVQQKSNPPPNLGCRCFTHSTETIMWASKAGKKSKAKYTFNYQDMRNLNGGKQMKNVWNINAPGKDEKKHGSHPTQKSEALVMRCLLASTQPGDTVFDPFMGSGTTGVAAINLNRTFIGAELDEEYARIAENRIKSVI